MLAEVMLSVKRMIETLPEEGLLRNKAWRDLEPMVRREVQRYGKALGPGLVQQMEDNAGELKEAALRQAVQAGADLNISTVRQDVPDSVQMALNAKVDKATVSQLFNLDPTSPSTRARIDQSLFRVIDTRVRGGIIRGDTTRDIADLMAVDTPPRVSQAFIWGGSAADPQLPWQWPGPLQQISRQVRTQTMTRTPRRLKILS